MLSLPSPVDPARGGGEDLRILTVAAVYPNASEPCLGTFALERVRALARHAEVRVVAPVPWFPRSPALGKLSRRWHAHAVVPREERRPDHLVDHPRRIVIPKLGGFTSGFFYAHTLRRHLRAVREQFDFDVLDVHFAWPDGFAAVRAARGLGVPVCLTLHGSDLTLMPSFPTIRPFVRHALRAADRLIAVSGSLAERALALGAAPERLSVVPNGVDTARFRPVPREEACAALGLAADRPRVLSVGSLIERKGHEHLIDAVARLVGPGGHGDLELVIVGEGPRRRALQARIRRLGLGGHVRLVGAVPHDELLTWFGAADLFALASSREGWPTVLFESWACGVPVVATAVDGVPEAVHSPVHGLLVDRQDAELLARRLAEALGRSWDRGAMQAYAAENTWDVQAGHALAELYELRAARGSGAFSTMR